MLQKISKVGASALVAAAVLYMSVAAAEDGLRIHDAWMPEVPPIARAVAGYMVLENKDDKPWVLIGAGSHRFDKVMIHDTVMEGDIMRMVHQREIVIPPGETVVFEPDGLHLMLMDPHKTMERGESVDIVLVFKGGVEVPVRFRVGKTRPGEKGHRH